MGAVIGSAGRLSLITGRAARIHARKLALPLFGQQVTRLCCVAKPHAVLLDELPHMHDPNLGALTQSDTIVAP